ncbi:hypothetical protein [Jiangella endophytica]|uniref:hypothetical protein n=1 Tax=Jiangella endophytica TaxID=1623398 RepID=UPI0018E506DB|nr:hypothetical protein [Jiangella endophytica]
MTDFTLAIPQKHFYEKGPKVIRGILDHGSNGWRVELYDTEPLRRTIIEIDALPTWADASAVMNSAFKLVS